VSRAIHGVVAERKSGAASLGRSAETLRITLYPVGSYRSLYPYPACSGKVARSKRTGPIFLTAIKALGAAGPCPSRFVADSLSKMPRRSSLRPSIPHPQGPARRADSAIGAMISLRANATSMIRRIRPRAVPTRSRNHCARVLPG
jgi:hypothetical protein